MGVVFLDPAPAVNDGFDAVAQYQMVPAGGVRRMALLVQADETEDVLVFVSNPNHASVFGLFAVQGSASVRGSGFLVKRDSAIRFFISGRDPGITTIVVETVTGKPRGFLLLSVKAQLRRTYQLAVLSDPIHVPDKQGVGNNLLANMRAAEQIWFAQANVVLQRIGPINDVVVPKNLGDPINLDDRANVLAIANATATPQAVPADLFVYASWDIISGPNPFVGGFNTGNMLFVENQFRGRIGALMCAHEIGHALRLPHTDGDSRVLMTSGGIQDDFIDMRDIEAVHRF